VRPARVNEERDGKDPSEIYDAQGCRGNHASASIDDLRADGKGKIPASGVSGRRAIGAVARGGDYRLAG